MRSWGETQRITRCLIDLSQVHVAILGNSRDDAVAATRLPIFSHHCAQTMLMRRNPSSVRTALLLSIWSGVILNVCHLLKVKYLPDDSSRRNQVEKFSTSTGHRIQGVAKRSTRHWNDLVKANDFVYSKAWDAAPIVIESHKLVFFTVPKAG